MNLIDLLKSAGAPLAWVGGAIVVTYLLVFEVIVSGRRFRREEQKHAEDTRRLIENGERWEKRYLDNTELVRKQLDCLRETVDLLKQMTERTP